MREGWLGGIVRLDLNPTALVVARPGDKLTCRLWIYENATWTVVKKYIFQLLFWTICFGLFLIKGMPTLVRKRLLLIRCFLQICYLICCQMTKGTGANWTVGKKIDTYLPALITSCFCSNHWPNRFPLSHSFSPLHIKF